MILPRHALEPARDRIRRELTGAAADRPLCAVLDAARLPALPEQLEALGIPFHPLAAERTDRALVRVTPVLAEMALTPRLFLWLDAQPEILTACVFLVTPAPIARIRTHLKRYLWVQDPDARPRFFRFYDPRVLGPFLSASDDHERRGFLGPLTRVLFRDPHDPAISSAPALLQWDAPAPANPVALPTRRRPFRLRPEHRVALEEDALRRFRDRALHYLTRRHPGPAERTGEHLDAAFALGASLGLGAGRDISMLAEALLSGAETACQGLAQLEPAARRDRLVQLHRSLTPEIVQ